MSFGKRGLDAGADGAASRKRLRRDFIKSPSSLWSGAPVVLRELRGLWTSRIASDRLLYPLTCLTLGLLLNKPLAKAVHRQKPMDVSPDGSAASRHRRHRFSA